MKTTFHIQKKPSLQLARIKSYGLFHEKYIGNFYFSHPFLKISIEYFIVIFHPYIKNIRKETLFIFPITLIYLLFHSYRIFLHVIYL